MAGVQVTGLTEVLRAMGKLQRDSGPAIADALQKGGEVILRKSQKYVPVDKGPLKASGVVVTVGSGMGARTTVSYGGPTAPYALYVHEDLTKLHKSPTCAKFLEKAARETRGTCTSILARNLGIRSGFIKDGVDVG